mgnify:FL=1
MDGDSGARRVLIVDDAPAVVEKVRLCLEESGPPEYELFPVASVQAGVERLLAERFDVVLVDVDLSDAPGASAVAALCEAAPEPPIVVLTDRAASENVVAALRDGAEDYLTKGKLNGEYLRHAVRFAIERHRFRLRKKRRFDELTLISKAVPGILYRLEVDPHGRLSFPFLSEKVAEIYGIAPPEEGSAADALWDAVIEEDLADLNRSVDEAVKGERGWEHTYRIRHPRNGIRVLRGISRFAGRAPDGTRSWIGIILDRTEEEARTEELRKYSLVIERTDTAAIITDPEGHTLWVNPGFEKLVGFSRDELIGKKPGDLLQGPETNPETVRYMSERRAAGKGYEVEVLNYRGGTEPYWMFLNVEPAFDAEGRLEYFVGVQHDVTESREREKQLRRVKEEAEAANVAKSQFLAIMSHEIRTPLNAIIGLSEILREDPDVEEKEDFLELIDANGRTLVGLISDILDFSKIEAGGTELEREEIDLEEWFREQIRLLEGGAREKGLSLEFRFDPGLPRRWRLDSNRLRQVVVNLVRNAIKFTSEGFVRVEVEPAEEGGIVLSVTDSGIGVPEEKQAAIFEPFRQADSSNTREFGGTGLGLSICQRAVELKGGRIELESEEGKGSTFRVHLPLESVRAESGPSETEAGAFPGSPAAGGDANRSGPGDLLVAEDNPTNRKVMRRILEREGFRVEAVEDGEEAVEACRRGAYRMVFMDLQMPGIDGLEATRRIKADPGCGDPLVVVFSASVQNTDREASFAAGADEFLPKPVSLKAMRELLARRGMASEPPG